MPATAAVPATPIADRPRMPKGYGVPSSTNGLLAWDVVAGWLDAARVFWVATSGSAAQPRVRPVDGLYVDGLLLVGGSPETRWVRDLRENPKVAIHLGGDADVAIIEGTAEFAGLPADLARKVAEASNAKFGYGMSAEDYTRDGVISIRPRVAYAWSGGLTNMTRFRFEG
jgi:hypothetical protein